MKKLLIVDDREDNLYLLRVLLENNDYSIETARHGAEALAKARTSAPDMIISDILMPVMDGFTLCRYWKDDAHLKHIPFVFYTATYTEPQDEQLATVLGADAFIVKPAEPEVFLARLQDVLVLSETGKLAVPREIQANEKNLLLQYNEVLVHKLEEKMSQLERANRALEQDIAERRRIEEELRESEDRWRRLVEHNTACLAVLGEGRVQYINKAGLKLFGATRLEEVVGKPWLDFVHPDFQEKVAARVKRMMESDQPVELMEERLLRLDGIAVDTEVTAIPLTQMGKRVIMTVCWDITERKRMEEQIENAHKLESIGTLASGIAHDFNNLLGIILGNATLLSRLKVSDPGFHKRVQVITDTCNRGVFLVRQILTFARKTTIELEMIDINSVIGELMKLLAETFPKTVTISLQLEKPLPLILLDHTQLHQAILNLCVNSRDAMHDHGTLAIKTRLVYQEEMAALFPSAETRDYVAFSVSDSGIGMNEATRKRIFEPFFTTKEKGQGTGLGLAVLYGIVQTHHGFVNVQSEIGRGATFEVFFPAARGADVYALQEHRKIEEPPGGSETILLVEDEDYLLTFLVELFESKGYRILTARNGREAIQEYARRHEEIDLVFTDLGLPEADGLEVTRQLKRIDPKLKIVLGSGYFEPAKKIEFSAAGADQLVQKPYNIDDILKKVRMLLDQA